MHLQCKSIDQKMLVRGSRNAVFEIYSLSFVHHIIHIWLHPGPLVHEILPSSYRDVSGRG